jgi:hypothetical protein
METRMPSRLTGGESIIRSTATGNALTFSGYTPADGWALVYQFAAETPIEITGEPTDDNAGWDIEVSGSQTFLFQPGLLAYSAFAQKTVGDSERSFLVDQGRIDVTANPMRVSQWKAVLSAIDAAIAEYATTPQGSVTVDGMSVSYRSMSDLTKMRSYVQEMLRRDTSNRLPKRILSRFGRFG